jgi:hypothetical protein
MHKHLPSDAETQILPAVTRLTLSVIALICLAGCVTTVEELRRSGIRAQTLAPYEPQAAARCLQRAIDAESGKWNTRVTPLEGGAYEVLARVEPKLDLPARTEGAQMLFEVRPVPGAPNQSSIDAWLAHWGINPTEQRLRDLVANCPRDR